MISDQLVKSVSYSQDEILNWIDRLYLHGGIYYDATYSIGNFYKTIAQPEIKSDINPLTRVDFLATSTLLPLANNSCRNIMFDPPFVVGPSNKPGIMRDRFSCFKNAPVLWEFYGVSLREFYRVLSVGGFLIFKCQDIVSGGKNYFSHVNIMMQAYNIGFYPRDLFVYVAKTRVISPNMLNQQHARKYHSYFWVFEKVNSTVKYTMPL